MFFVKKKVNFIKQFFLSCDIPTGLIFFGEEEISEEFRSEFVFIY